jgi:hypothetical protein
VLMAGNSDEPLRVVRFVLTDAILMDVPDGPLRERNHRETSSEAAISLWSVASMPPANSRRTDEDR